MRTSAESARAAGESARIARDQLEATLAAHRAALLPYVWADLRPRDDADTLMLQVGNTGPTVATNVAVTFDPPLVNIALHDREEDTRALEALCKSGLGSLAPGRTFRWSLGPIHRHFPNTGADPVPSITLTVTAKGPGGVDIDPLLYVIKMEDLKHQARRPESFALVEKPLLKISKTLEDWRKQSGND